jgi:hypothetical protein
MHLSRPNSNYRNNLVGNPNKRLYGKPWLKNEGVAIRLDTERFLDKSLPRNKGHTQFFLDNVCHWADTHHPKSLFFLFCKVLMISFLEVGLDIGCRKDRLIPDLIWLCLWRVLNQELLSSCFETSSLSPWTGTVGAGDRWGKKFRILPGLKEGCRLGYVLWFVLKCYINRVWNKWIFNWSPKTLFENLPYNTLWPQQFP